MFNGRFHPFYQFANSSRSEVTAMDANFVRDLFESRPELEQYLDEVRRQVKPTSYRRSAQVSEQSFFVDQSQDSFRYFLFGFNIFLSLIPLLLALLFYLIKTKTYTVQMDRTRQQARIQQEESFELSTFS